MAVPPTTTTIVLSPDHSSGCTLDPGVATSSALLETLLLSGPDRNNHDHPPEPIYSHSRHSAPSYVEKPTSDSAPTEILLSSLADLDASSSSSPHPRILPCPSALVGAIARAAAQNLHLVLRPDDVWLAILLQLSCCLRRRAEADRRGEWLAAAAAAATVVGTVAGARRSGGKAHGWWVLGGQRSGSEEREIDVDFSGFFDGAGADAGDEEDGNNGNNDDDAEKRERNTPTSTPGEVIGDAVRRARIANHIMYHCWVLPRFSTTTPEDRAVAAMVMMAPTRDCATYPGGPGPVHIPSGTAAGAESSSESESDESAFPENAAPFYATAAAAAAADSTSTTTMAAVTLHGTADDWRALLGRVQRLRSGCFGAEPAEWADWLRVVLRGMLCSLEEPCSDAARAFWREACGFEAAAAAAKQGCVRDVCYHENAGEGVCNCSLQLSGWVTAFCFWGADGSRLGGEEGGRGRAHWAEETRQETWELAGVEFPTVVWGAIPRAMAWTPIKAWMGPEEESEANGWVRATLVAGFTGVAVSGSDLTALTDVRPRAGWWLLSRQD